MFNKDTTLIGQLGIDDEEGIENVQMDSNSKKAVRLISFIKQYQELTLTTRDDDEFLGRRVVTIWEHGEEELSK